MTLYNLHLVQNGGEKEQTKAKRRMWESAEKGILTPELKFRLKIFIKF